MGIQNLLQFLKPLYKEKNICEFKGEKVAVDCYVWLHRAIYTCGRELAENIPTTK